MRCGFVLGIVFVLSRGYVSLSFSLSQVGFAEGDGLVEAAWSTARCDARLGFLVLEVTGETRLRPFAFAMRLRCDAHA
jgi:hypothetical protein